MYFMIFFDFFYLCTVPLESCTVVTSQIFNGMPPERAAYKKLIPILKNQSS